MSNTITEVVRVGVMNNFDMTYDEFDHLGQFQKEGRRFFVNCNAHTELNEHSLIPVIVTVNPDVGTFLPLLGPTLNVAALRVKVHPDLQVSHFEEMNYPPHIPILLTGMRFKSRATLEKFVTEGNRSAYEHRGGWFRLTPEAWKTEIDHWKEFPTLRNPVSVCDESGKGCPDCMNCSALTYNTKEVTLKGLNLSTSGIGGKCFYDCPDCFAKSLLMGKWPKLNSITANSKQKGKA